MDTRRLTERWLIRIAFIVVCCTSSANTTSAQTLDRSAPLTGSAAIAAIGDDAGDGLMAAAHEELRRQVAAAPVRVERRSDSLLNGALIGAAAGVGSGLLLCRASEPWRNCRDDVGPILKFAAIGAGIGMGIDALIRERVIRSQSSMGATEVRVAPMVGRGAGGLRLGVSF